MKDNNHNDHIRSLLHKYYEGESTPEEESLLVSFFKVTPEGEIPEDLSDEVILFRSLSMLNSEISDLEIPDDLFERISSVSNAPLASSSRNFERKWMRRIAYVVAAACVVLLLYHGTQYLPFNHKPEGIATMTANVSDAHLSEDGFIEITDPEEAEKIMFEIGRLLATNTKQSNEAIQHLEKTVDEYKELTKSILK